jgi:hypothetical protein
MSTTIIERRESNFLWKLFSYILHPLFIPVYLTAFLIYCCPQIFDHTTQQKNSLLVNIFVNLVLFPALTLFLLKQLKFIDSIFLKTQRERIIPIFSYTIYTFWVWAFVLMKNPANYPSMAVKLGLVFFISSSITLVCNSFYKISLHMIGAGMALGLGIIAFVKLKIDPLWMVFALLLSVAIFLSRKKEGDHTSFELYSGFMVGLLTMIGLQLLF